MFLAGIITAISVVTPHSTLAQNRSKSELEKKNDRKNKANRRKKRRGDKAKKGTRTQRYTKFKTRSRQGEKAYKGDITGRKLITKTSPRRSSAAKANPSPYAGRSRQGEGSRFKARSVNPRYSSRARERAGFRRGRDASNNTFRISFIGKKSYRKASSTTRSASRPSERNIKVKRIVPRSSSGAYVTRRKRGPYSSFRKKTKWERASSGDIAGRSLRLRKTTERPTIKSPRQVRFTGGSRRRGDRPYSGKAKRGYVSATKSPENAWNKSISGFKLKKKRSKRPKYNSPQFQTFKRGPKTGDTPFRGKSPFNGYKSATRKPEKGGQRKLAVREPRTKTGFNFRGNIKAGKPLKGGGSISGRTWNNRGKPLQKGGPSRQDGRIAKFQGGIKGGRPQKGGGSISGKRWNNGGKPLQNSGPNRQDTRIAKFQGGIKGTKPQKGGGSVNRNGWNNRGKPLQNDGPNRQDNRISKFQGGIKAGRNKPLKGAGGSVTILPWNNKEKPITKDGLTPEDYRIVKHRGNIKRKKYVVNPSSGKDANKVRSRPGSYDKMVAFQGRVKRKRKYKQNPSAGDESLKNIAPSEATAKAYKFQGRMKRTWKYKRNPSTGDESLKNIAPSGTTSQAYKFQGRFKLTSTYRKKPYAGKDALKGIGPSRATVKASNYQGNIKMSRKRLEDRHPSFKYASGKKTSVQEKDKFFSFKLLWAKLFKKNEDQPDNLKEKNRRPRFDKREKDLWYD
ncbi:MAG: hypothetical protein AAFN93_09390 [Bacteroidota bacterium]